MKSTIMGVLGAVAMLCAAAPASAQDYYTFDLYNATPWTIMTFRTGEPGGTYSDDWMPTRVLAPGDNVSMRFDNSESACEYYVKILFEDGDEWERKLNFCELEAVLVSEDGIEAIE